jgi:hypothetical protein
MWPSRELCGASWATSQHTFKRTLLLTMHGKRPACCVFIEDPLHGAIVSIQVQWVSRVSKHMPWNSALRDARRFTTGRGRGALRQQLEMVRLSRSPLNPSYW